MCRISQFPDDNEHVLGPLSHFEVVGMKRELVCSPDKYTLNVIEVKLNRNLKAQVYPTSRNPPPPLLVIPFCIASSMHDMAYISHKSWARMYADA